MTVRVLNYGGGVNSTALLCLAAERKIPLDVVVFADTGSERPETYRYLQAMSEFNREHELPPIDVVRWIRVRGEDAGKFIALHVWCEREKTVPSRAYGYSGCSVKWKQQPADKFVAGHPLVKVAHAKGERVERWIGFDYDEPQRAERMWFKNREQQQWLWRAPLVEWKLGRDACVEAIARAGLESPGKSACWMCPSSKKHEISQMATEHPELLGRALRMEASAIAAGNLGQHGGVKGLGARLNWGEYVKTGLGLEPEDLPCGCYDGTEDE